MLLAKPPVFNARGDDSRWSPKNGVAHFGIKAGENDQLTMREQVKAAELAVFHEG